MMYQQYRNEHSLNSVTDIGHTHSVDAPGSCWQVPGTVTQCSLDRTSPYLMINGT